MRARGALGIQVNEEQRVLMLATMNQSESEPTRVKVRNRAVSCTAVQDYLTEDQHYWSRQLNLGSQLCLKDKPR